MKILPEVAKKLDFLEIILSKYKVVQIEKYPNVYFIREDNNPYCTFLSGIDDCGIRFLDFAMHEDVEEGYMGDKCLIVQILMKIVKNKDGSHMENSDFVIDQLFKFLCYWFKEHYELNIKYFKSDESFYAKMNKTYNTPNYMAKFVESGKHKNILIPRVK